MNKTIIPRVLDKVGVFGTIVSGFSCAMCFPALATIGAAIGLGFLSRWEGFFVHILIPAFLILALLANGLGYFGHHQWQRTALGVVGPLVALLGDQGMTQHFLAVEMARVLFYGGLVLMIVFAIWDLLNPAHKRCSIPAGDDHSNC